MDPEFLRDRLFRPFDTTKGVAGMGIGAHQAREYVRSLGGLVDVQSSPGQGTRFAITLPALVE
jgi:signal transduction histidine kinase